MTINIQTRLKVFETNSSSSHSMTLAAGDVVALPFPKATLREGVVTLRKGEFGWDWFRIYNLQGKLEYLLTQLFSESIPNGEPDEVLAQLKTESDRFAQLCRLVETETGCRIEVQPGSSGYIDHDSVGVALGVFESEADLRQLLFNDKSYIETGNDNSQPPFQIETSRGREDYLKAIEPKPPTRKVPSKPKRATSK